MDSDTRRDISIVKYITKQPYDENEDYIFDLNMQKQVLDSTINSNLIKRYPMKTSYQKAFLKLFMAKIEASGNDIHDDLYTAYCRLISLQDEESVHYRHFLVENATLSCITLKESTNLISKGTTGLCSWQAAVVLSDWCAENIEKFHGKNILELGCGVGLTGMSIISICSPKQYIFSDCHPTVLDMLCENVKLNFLLNKQHKLSNMCDTSLRLKLQLKYEQTDIQIIDLKWQDINKYVAEGFSQPDIIIAADILYESDSFNSLTIGLKNLLTSINYAVFAATVRNEDTISQFLEYLGNHNLAFEECILPKWTVLIQSINSPVRILKIFRKT
ncbi:protein-lysine N-methyltransferase EEF2KMT isoform X2 [Anoplolepis gracilipes]|uniref:protein-lysine N-methyltransferase EEF2KMT isoform X2 n=1 Tax=Anoplolepis gracilipes TaxID=354296 RepID=UPI003BA07FBA